MTSESSAAGRRSVLFGWLCGMSAALIWAAFQVLTKHGISGAAGGGFRPLELQLFRFGMPGLILLPVALARGTAEMRRLGWRRLAVLSLCSGPLLGLLNFEGYSLAPLSHGAVLAPAFSTLWGVVLAAVILRAPQSRAQRAGLLLILLGLAVVGGVGGGTLHEHLGDLMFCMSGLLWGFYTVLLRMWNIDGLIGAAIVGLCSSLPSFALFAASADFEHLLEIPSGPFWTQAIFQSLFAGSLSVIAFGYAVQHLGASRAALFPATVPLLALSAGDLLFDAQVRPAQWIGLIVTTVGLMFALNVIRLRAAASPLRVPAS